MFYIISPKTNRFKRQLIQTAIGWFMFDKAFC